MSFVQEERSERKLMALTVWACYWYFYELVAILRGLLYQSLVTFVIIVYYYLVLMTVCLFFARFWLGFCGFLQLLKITVALKPLM